MTYVFTSALLLTLALLGLAALRQMMETDARPMKVSQDRHAAHKRANRNPSGA